MTAPFIGVYSFPKSGNTWMRQILAELFFDGSIAACPDIHRQDIHEAPVATLPDGTLVRFYKSHAPTIVQRSRQKPVDHAAVIYIRRHPLDVFLSYLNFMRSDVNKAPPLKRLFKPFASVEQLVENGEIASFLEAFILFGTIDPQFAASGSWFENVANWNAPSIVVGNTEIPVVHLRYEDMVANGADALEPVRALMGISRVDMETALTKAAEKTKRDGKFFWKQTPGLYKDMLPAKLIRRFADYHGERVRALGYDIEVSNG